MAPYYPAAAHAQSGVKQSVLSVCLSFCRQTNIEIRPLRTVYGFKEHWNKYLLPFLGAGFVHMALSRECYIAVPKISDVRPAYCNCKLRANTDGMHGWSLKLRRACPG